MKSFIAALRSLVLPFGATTGRRILLDGVTGKIILFDSANNQRIIIGENDDNIVLRSGVAGEADGAEILTFGLNAGAADAQAGLRMTSPAFAFPDNSQSDIELYSEASDGSAQPSILITTETVEFHAANFANGVDVELIATASASARLHVGGASPVPDIEIANGDITRDGQSYPRGLVATGEEATDVVLSTTAGTYTDVVESSAFDAVAGRAYRVMFSGGHDLLIAGSGFATTDAWEYKFQRDVGSGYGDVAPLSGPKYIVRSNVAIAMRYAIPVHIAYYLPSADAAGVTVKLHARKQSGAATVTSELETSAGATPFRIDVEDIGLAI
jgi:hypothetical protein